MNIDHGRMLLIGLLPSYGSVRCFNTVHVHMPKYGTPHSGMDPALSARNHVPQRHDYRPF